jgi:Na+/H+ antiporter NhaD/arsenite permease-like protein
MTPPVIQMCVARRLDPRPFLLALACSANVGSAATLIGNPQNMLVGQTLHLSFGGYLLQAIVPAAAGLPVIWGVVRLAYGRRMTLEGAGPGVENEARPFDRWQAAKGVVLLAAVIAAFLVTGWPRDVVALVAAGVLLVSRRVRSRETLALVDWQLLVLFIGLFVVNAALARTGVTAAATEGLAGAGVDLARPGVLFALTAVLSNLVSNVPAVMLLLPAAEHPAAGPVLALSSTLAGNLLVVGSIANIIVLEQAARMGVPISWREHARVGVPVGLITLLMAAAWLALAG